MDLGTEDYQVLMIRRDWKLLMFFALMIGVSVQSRGEELFGIDLGQSWTMAEIRSGKDDGNQDYEALKFAVRRMETKVFFKDDKASFVIALDDKHKTGYQCAGVTIFRGSNRILTEADKLNGIEKKWNFYLMSKAYRQAKGDKWSDWVNGRPVLSNFIAVNVHLKGGKLIVAPPDHYKKLQRWVVK